MRQRDIQAVFIALGVVCAPPTAAAREPCNPPRQTCDGGDGITYQCPPCPPRLAPNSKTTLETYRESLESYRQELEERRASDPAGSLEDYRKGLGRYREGIDSYREGQAVVRARQGSE